MTDLIRPHRIFLGLSYPARSVRGSSSLTSAGDLKTGPTGSMKGAFADRRPSKDDDTLCWSTVQHRHRVKRQDQSFGELRWVNQSDFKLLVEGAKRSWKRLSLPTKLIVVCRWASFKGTPVVTTFDFLVILQY